MSEEELKELIREEIDKYLSGEGKAELGFLAAEAINEKRRAAGQTDLDL